MSEPVREQALAKVVAKLLTMTGARPWGGSYPSDPHVERVYKATAQIHQFPHLVVLPDVGSRFAQQATGSANFARFLHEFRVVIYGYVKGDDVVAPSTWAERLWDDAVGVLLKNPTLDGVVRHLTIDDPAPEEIGDLAGAGMLVAGFVQGITIDIDEDREVG